MIYSTIYPYAHLKWGTEHVHFFRDRLNSCHREGILAVPSSSLCDGFSVCGNTVVEGKVKCRILHHLPQPCTYRATSTELRTSIWDVRLEDQIHLRYPLEILVFVYDIDIHLGCRHPSGTRISQIIVHIPDEHRRWISISHMDVHIQD